MQRNEKRISRSKEQVCGCDVLLTNLFILKFYYMVDKRIENHAKHANHMKESANIMNKSIQTWKNN